MSGRQKGSPSTWYYSDKGKENHDKIIWESAKAKGKGVQRKNERDEPVLVSDIEVVEKDRLSVSES